MPSLRGHEKTHCSEDTVTTLPQPQLSLCPELKLLTLRWDTQSNHFIWKAQTSLLSAPKFEPGLDESEAGETAPWIARMEATRNTFRVILLCLLRRRCWKITSSGRLHPRATLVLFDLQTALSSAICGFLCTLTPPAWIHPKKYSSPKTHILLFIFTYPPACLAVHCSIMWSLCFPGRFSSSKESLKWRLFE